MPHGLGIDPDGNVWVADAGRHQAIKFSPQGKELAAIGLRVKPGHDVSHLCKPAAVRAPAVRFCQDQSQCQGQRRWVRLFNVLGLRLRLW